MPLVKKRFPNLQIIATTHSPLLVAGMGRDEVRIVFRSDEDRSKLNIIEPPLEFEGMRADQILTSPLFGLATTRGSGTRRERLTRAGRLGLRVARATRSPPWPSHDESRVRRECQPGFRMRQPLPATTPTWG